MRSFKLIVCLVMLSSAAGAQTLKCDMGNYKPVEGVRAEIKGGAVTMTWDGEAEEQLMAEFTVRDGQPIVQQLAARKAGGPWAVLGKDLSPDFEVSTGKRRISTTQTRMMARAKTDTPENEDARKWDTFWDAPLVVPGGNSVKGTPRDPNEIRRAKVSYKSDSCKVTTDGDTCQRQLQWADAGHLRRRSAIHGLQRTQTCFGRRLLPRPIPFRRLYL